MSLKKLYKDSNEITKTGLVLSFGSSVAKDNAYSQQALGNLSSKLPLVANVKGTGIVLDSLNSLKKKKY